MDYISKLLSKRYAPRWLVLSIDTAICIFSFMIAWHLRYNFYLPAGLYEQIMFGLLIVLVVRMISFKIGRPYSGIVRYTSTEDAKRIFLTVSGGSAFMFLLNYSWFFASGSVFIPLSVLILDFTFTLLLMAAFRVLVKIIFVSWMNPKRRNATNIAIYGAGRSGLITKRTMDQDGNNPFNVVCFFDDDPEKAGKFIEGVPIYHSKGYLDSVLQQGKVDELILSIQKISSTEKEKIVEHCLHYNVRVKVVPPVNTWINGELSSKQIKNVRIEDLMDRAPIQLGLENIKQDVRGMVLMITGASGSIGKELVKQLAGFSPSRMILVDVAETPLHELSLEMEDDDFQTEVEVVIGDVKNRSSMQKIFDEYRPEMVYHAAAYKHVPLMEANPYEAVMNNIEGTRVMSDLALAYKVKKFVFISTDKAVNPTNVMGASKRIAEIYVQSLNMFLTSENGHGVTRFITTRFGNVLGSNGSVIPRFRKQIARRGPVTVTHPDVTRFFMTIPEACQLIIEAGYMGKGGEIFIFDMGRSVKILDLAEKMIKLSGFEPGKDIRIEFTGLRPGEKIFEELLSKEENTVPTYHSKIMIAKVREYAYDMASRQIDDLIYIARKGKPQDIVRKMKEIVPEYISKNSEFEGLDKRAIKTGVK